MLYDSSGRFLPIVCVSGSDFMKKGVPRIRIVSPIAAILYIRRGIKKANMKENSPTPIATTEANAANEYKNMIIS